MRETITIAQRFCGPPAIANGGYVAGLLAQRLAGPTRAGATLTDATPADATPAGATEVTLRRPTPLDRPLTIDETAAGTVALRDETEPLAEARRAPLTLTPPASPGVAAAMEAARAYLGFTTHGASRCFVCGPGRDAADGLRIFAGPLGTTAHVAAPWVPGADLADEEGLVRPEFLWAALDCPGAFALMGQRHRPMLLGRLTARLDGRIRIGERCVVLAWPIAVAGRKQIAGSAVFGAGGALCGLAQATWFEVAHY